MGQQKVRAKEGLLTFLISQNSRFEVYQEAPPPERHSLFPKIFFGGTVQENISAYKTLLHNLFVGVRDAHGHLFINQFYQVYNGKALDISGVYILLVGRHFTCG